MIVKTEAIVLRTMKYRETSKIVTLFTKKYGKLSAVAKGARDRKLRFGSALDSLNYVQAVLYKKDGRDLHLLSQCDVIKQFARLSQDLDRLGAGMAILELVQSVARAEEESSVLFRAVLDSLTIMNDTAVDVSGVLLHFELKLLEILGFRPGLSLCSSCKSPLEFCSSGTKSQVFRSSPGGIICPLCLAKHRGSAQVSREAVSLLRALQETTVSRVMEMKLTPSLCEEGKKILWYYFKCHVEGIRPLRSEAVFSAVA